MMEMDGQQSAHGESYAYTSPYWAEFYDMWVEDIIGSAALAKDDDFFFNLLSPFLPNSTRVRGPLRVVDMATGTGRVIRGILQKMNSLAQGELPGDIQKELEIWGIDHSQAMIDRAKGLLENKMKPSTTMVWRTSAAANFVDENQELRNAVDLLIFAAGSIGHLTAHGERRKFLQQAVKALRITNPPQTPRSMAAISILKPDDSLEENCSEQDVAGKEVRFNAEMRKPSRQWPHLEYCKSETMTLRDKGILVDSFDLNVVETATGKLISQEKYSWSLQVFSQTEWERELSDCGLSISQKVETGSETWYILHLANKNSLV
jgi:SAM-dependent methyltransferase